MGIIKKLFSNDINNDSKYYCTHNIGGILIDVDTILDCVFGFESHAEVPYLKKFIINEGESNLPQYNNYVAIVEKIGIINNDKLVLSTKNTHLPTVYFTLESCKNYLKHSILDSEFYKKLRLSNSHVYNGLI